MSFEFEKISKVSLSILLVVVEAALDRPCYTCLFVLMVVVLVMVVAVVRGEFGLSRRCLIMSRCPLENCIQTSAQIINLS